MACKTKIFNRIKTKSYSEVYILVRITQKNLAKESGFASIDKLVDYFLRCFTVASSDLITVERKRYSWYFTLKKLQGSPPEIVEGILKLNKAVREIIISYYYK